MFLTKLEFGQALLDRRARVILRTRPGKATAEIHDYHDIRTPVLTGSLARCPRLYPPRLPGPRRAGSTPAERGRREPQPGVLPGYTIKVKTAISVPDETFEQATRKAAELGISRSEFFSRAARRYLDELASRSLTEQVNAALTAAGGDDSAAAAAQAGRRRLAAGDEW